jgi:hypothetical protein
MLADGRSADSALPGQKKSSPLRLGFPLFWLIVAIFAAGFAYFINRRGAFLADDYIFLGQLTFSHNSLLDNLSWFGRDWGVGVQFYRPWVRLFYYFQFVFFGENPAGWHLFSVFLHMLNTAMVYVLGWLVSRRVAVGAVAGLVFALQPIHTEPVSWISGQTDLWATLFALGSLTCWAIYRRSLRGLSKWYAGTVICFVLALLSKEVAIAIPLALLGYDFITGGIDRIWQHVSPRPGITTRLLKNHGAFWVILALYFGLRLLLFNGLGGYTPESGQLVDLGNFLSSYSGWLLLPLGLSGTTGLVLLGLMIAFLALCGVQEWERHRLAHGLPLEIAEQRPEPAPETLDDELDDPQAPRGKAPSPSRLSTRGEISSPVMVMAHDFSPPPYYSLRTAGFGLLLIITFLLPVLLTSPAERFTYLPSTGFALIAGAVLAPFGNLQSTGPRFRQNYLELGFWLRILTIIALLMIYLVTTNARVTQWLEAGYTAKDILKTTREVIPGVQNYTRFLSEGVPDSNGGALIFRTGYGDAVRMLYRNDTVDVQKVNRLPIVTDRLKDSIFLEYKSSTRLINHTEVVETLSRRNEVLKQFKPFLSWNMQRNAPPNAVSGNWFEVNGVGGLNYTDAGLALTVARSVNLQSPDFSIPAVQLGAIDITMKVTPKGRAFRGEVSWYAGSSFDSSARSSEFFDIIADGQFRTYRVVLKSDSGFAYADIISRVRLSLPEGLEEVVIQKIEQTQLPVEYKQLSR